MLDSHDRALDHAEARLGIGGSVSRSGAMGHFMKRLAEVAKAVKFNLAECLQRVEDFRWDVAGVRHLALHRLSRIVHELLAEVVLVLPDQITERVEIRAR